MSMLSLRDYLWTYQNTNSNILDCHLIVRQLFLQFLNNPKLFNFNSYEIMIDISIDTIIINPENPTGKCERLSFCDLLKHIPNVDLEFIDHCRKYENAPNKFSKKELIEKYKKILIPDGFEAVGYGHHSVLIHSSEFYNEQLFKYTKQDISFEIESKKILGYQLISPNLSIRNSFCTNIPYYKNGTLTKYLKQNQELSNRELLSKFIEVCQNVQAIHRHGILLEYINPNFFLLDDYFFPHYIFFEVASFHGVVSPDFQMSYYIAPEVKHEKYKYVRCDQQSDIFSLGCVLNYMFNHCYPNSRLTPLIPHSIWQLILSMTHREPSCRPKIEDVIIECKNLQLHFLKNEECQEEIHFITPYCEEKIKPYMNIRFEFVRRQNQKINLNSLTQANQEGYQRRCIISR